MCVLRACEYRLCSSTSHHNDEVIKIAALDILNLLTPMFDATGDMT